ncbi:MAG: metal ABC transporter solute-binding protein, Zn/Mn family [Thermodesulfobacteriota bacterium]
MPALTPRPSPSPWLPALLLTAMLLSFWGSSCLAAEKTRVYVTVPPQAFLAKQLTDGEEVEVLTLIGRGQDPHTFEPTPRQAAALAAARIFFTVELPFERQLVNKVRAGNPSLKVVDTTSGISHLPMTDDHHHGGAAHDVHGAESQWDPHVWMTPANLQRMATVMATALGEEMPARRQAIDRNLAALDEELAGLERRITARLSPHRGKTFYVFHPGFGYFANAFGLTQKAVETGGKTPSPRQIATLIRQAQQDRVRVIFVQPQFDTKSAATVASGINGSVMPIDSLAENVTENLDRIATAIAESMP